MAEAAHVYPTQVFATLQADEDVHRAFFLFVEDGAVQVLSEQESRTWIEDGRVDAIDLDRLHEVMELAAGEIDGHPIAIGPQSIAPPPQPHVPDPEDVEELE